MSFNSENNDYELEFYKNIFKVTECKIDIVKLKQMIFLFNALENGWNIKKKDGCYVFKKHNNGEKEIYLSSYLSKFINNNLNYNENNS
jgi:hypothetical protein